MLAPQGNAIVTHEASKRYAEHGILSFSCNPGILQSLPAEDGPISYRHQVH